MSFHSRTSFGQSKRTIETKLARACGDKSPKGFLDEPIADLVDFINGHPEYVTTSSCSGRIVLFATFEKKWILAKFDSLLGHRRFFPMAMQCVALCFVRSLV